MIEVRPANIRDLSWIAARLNDEDRREIAAQVDDVAGMVCAHVGPECFTAHHRGKPVAAFGASPFWAGTWLAFMFGTSQSWRAVPEITRRMPDTEARIRALGCHRIEARSIEGHDRAQRWLTRNMGASLMGEARGHGLNGETFLVFHKEYV